MHVFRKLVAIGAAISALTAGWRAEAAEGLKLRPGISFYQDVDSGFPIVAEKMDDLKIEPGRPTLIFFGAAGDLNTNRQARRIVDLYRRYHDTALKFLLIDVDHCQISQAQQLLKEYYGGYIPAQVVLDKAGRKVWSQIGEVDSRLLEAQADKVI